MQKVQKIYRNVGSMEATGRTIRGLAVATNSWSKYLYSDVQGEFREIILPEALNAELVGKSDVMLCVDHNPGKVLARSKYGRGSLKLSVTDRGLEFETEAPHTTLGEDMLEMLRRGDYSQCSFCFTLGKGQERWYRDENGEMCREISGFDRLYDVSIVYDPAYDATACDARAIAVLDAMKHLDELENSINDIYVGKD